MILNWVRLNYKPGLDLENNILTLQQHEADLVNYIEICIKMMENYNYQEIGSCYWVVCCS